MTEGLFFLLLFCWAEPGAIREECVLIVFSSLFLCLCLFSLSLLLLHPLINYTHLLVHALRVIIVRCDVCVCVCVLIFPCFLYIYFFSSLSPPSSLFGRRFVHRVVYRREEEEHFFKTNFFFCFFFFRGWVSDPAMNYNTKRVFFSFLGVSCHASRRSKGRNPNQKQKVVVVKNEENERKNRKERKTRCDHHLCMYKTHLISCI